MVPSCCPASCAHASHAANCKGLLVGPLEEGLPVCNVVIPADVLDLFRHVLCHNLWLQTLGCTCIRNYNGWRRAELEGTKRAAEQHNDEPAPTRPCDNDSLKVLLRELHGPPLDSHRRGDGGQVVEGGMRQARAERNGHGTKQCYGLRCLQLHSHSNDQGEDNHTCQGVAKQRRAQHGEEHEESQHREEREGRHELWTHEQRGDCGS
mmetsp:Transcript_54371/g.129564  ORF Transcript_54371/g.129564 Transcript_54371/m.129564 type:complete len:207 (+) Transcript_54371:360-980(+)